MTVTFDPICCDECGVEITWTPIVIAGRPFCCHDCAVGLECDCAYNAPPEEDDSDSFWFGGVEGNPGSRHAVDYDYY